MKAAYPVIITPTNNGTSFVVDIPDFRTGTEGNSLADALEMARDAVGLIGIDMEDDGETLPNPSKLKDIAAQAKNGEIVTLVDVDFRLYRLRHDTKTVRRNVSLPCWLDRAAEEAGINVSALLQQALKDVLKPAQPH